MNYLRLIFISFFIINLSLYPLVYALKTSVIIPCHFRHAVFLYELLRTYEDQSELPDEVVISISESHGMNKETLQKLEKENWKFPVKIITSNQKLYAGQNRNIGCSHAIGDIFICQDADDLPHPQRIEIIKYFFSKFNLDHLLHGYDLIPKRKKYNLQEIPYKFCNNYKEVGDVANGNAAIARHVFEKIKWSSVPRGQDCEFNSNVYHYFKNNLVVQIPLLIYRRYLLPQPILKV